MERSRKADLISAALNKIDRMSAEELRAVLAAMQKIKENKSDQ